MYHILRLFITVFFPVLLKAVVDFRGHEPFVEYNFYNDPGYIAAERPEDYYHNANFSGCTFTNCRFDYLDLTGATFEGATINGINGVTSFSEGTSLVNVDFSNVIFFIHAQTTTAVVAFVRSNLSGANFTNAISNAFNNGPDNSLAYFSFYGSNLNSVIFNGVHLETNATTTGTQAQITFNGAYNTSRLSFANSSVISNAIGANSRASVDFSNVNLSNCNFSNSTITNTATGEGSQSYLYFNGAYLSEVNFTGSTISTAPNAIMTMNNATVSSTNLSGLNLSYTNFGNTNLSDSNLSHANLSHVDLGGANLANTNLIGADLTGNNSNSPHFNNTILLGITNEELGELFNSYTGTALTNDTSNLAEALGSRLENTDLSNINLSHVDLSNVDLLGTNLSYTNLNKANLTGAT